MPPANSKRLVLSVLSYLEGFMQAAQLANDRQAVWHWQECWCLVFGKFFGSHKVIAGTARVLPTVSAEVVSVPRPRWFVEKYSRPARKVIGQMTERVEGLKLREYFPSIYDVLECGHKIAAQVTDSGHKKSRWRYCRECPPKDEQMREASMTGSSTPPLKDGNKTAFALARAANPISGARREREVSA